MATTPLATNDTGRVKRKFNPYQHAFQQARRLRTRTGRRAYNRLGLFAGRRGGKTDAGGIAASEEASVKDSLGWCCAPSYPELHDYVLPAVLKSMPRSWLLPGKDGYSAQHSELRLINGARVGFRSLDDPERGRGPGLDWAWIDEGRKIAQKAWDTLQPALLDKKGVAWLTTSPNAFDWCVAEGSLVLTDRGDVPIETVTTRDRVWTRQGWKAVQHVTLMGVKATITLHVNGRRLSVTPDHRVATPAGWREAGTLVPASRRRTETLTTMAAAIGSDVGVPSIVEMPLRTEGRGELGADAAPESYVLAVRDRVEMGRVDARSVAADVMNLAALGNRALGDAVGEPMGALLAGRSNVGAATDDAVAVCPISTDRSGPNPTLPLGTAVVAEPLEIVAIEPGPCVKVWDIGVEEAHEFLAEGIVVHNCYKLFWLQAQLGTPGHWACKYKTSVNPSIDLNELEQHRLSMDPKWYQQEYEADFLSFAGTIFEYHEVEQQILRPSNSLEDLIRIRKFVPEWPRIDSSRLVYMSLDPGADHPFAGVLAVKVDEHLFIVGEHFRRNDTIKNHVDDFNKLLAKWNPGTPFEPESWAIDRSQRQWQIELQQEPYGIYTTQAPNDVIGGINRLHKWFGLRRLWLIEDLVPRTIEQLRGYVWDERNYDAFGRAVREKPKKENDDLPDALRYLVMLQPEPEIAVVSTVRDLKDFDESVRWQIERMRRIDTAAAEAAELHEEYDGDTDDYGVLDAGDGDYYGMGDFYRTAA